MIMVELYSVPQKNNWEFNDDIYNINLNKYQRDIHKIW